LFGWPSRPASLAPRRSVSSRFTATAAAWRLDFLFFPVLFLTPISSPSIKTRASVDGLDAVRSRHERVHLDLRELGPVYPEPGEAAERPSKRAEVRRRLAAHPTQQRRHAQLLEHLEGVGLCQRRQPHRCIVEGFGIDAAESYQHGRPELSVPHYAEK